MTIDKAYNKLKKIEKIKFKYITTDEDIINKGKAGQFLEKYLGISPGNNLNDFEDGELKTTKCQIKYNNILNLEEELLEEDNIFSIETLAITQISSNNIDKYLKSDFENSYLFNKILNFLIVPIIKKIDNKNLPFGEWYIPMIKKINYISHSEIYKKLKEDYCFIIEKISSNKFLKTYNGPNDYLQIRSKDSKPYKPVYSDFLKKDLSNKCYAFYFKKKFINEILK